MECFCGFLYENCIINKTKFYICKNCGHLKKVDIISEDKEKERYDLHICDDGYHKYMHNVFNKIKPYLNPGKSLDFGCGQIHLLSDILNENGFMSMCYDKYYYPNKINSSFDNIILIEVFEHISDGYNLLAELKSKLNENGKIIIMTQVIPDNIDNWWYLRDATHISFYTIKAFSILASKLNMKFEYDLKSSLFILSSI